MNQEEPHYGKRLRLSADGRNHFSGIISDGAHLPARGGPTGYGGRQPRCAIIAAVKGWPAAWAALLFFIPPHAGAAEDGNGAARELARKTAALAGRNEAVTVSWRNLSSLGTADLDQARSAFETVF